MSDPVTLSWKTINALPGAVEKPRYTPAEVTPGIVHFGIGNFHRSHMAAYLNDLMNLGDGRDWGIVGAGVTIHDERMRQRLAPQDFLTTVVEQDVNVERVAVSGAMIDFIAPGNRGSLLSKLTNPHVRIVSLTITEGGYFIDPATGDFQSEHPDIRADAGNLGEAKTVFGLIVAALAARRTAGIAPFTVLSCDNLPHNGDMTRKAVTGLAKLGDPGLANWIKAHVAFPNGMVDRITPAATEDQQHWLAEHHGIVDAAPVFCEPFRQWVLEDQFSAGRPALERVGVTFVGDVAPYELMKIRILNGGHAVIAYASGLLGIEFVHDAMLHPLVAGLLDKVTREEILPQVPPVPGVDLDAYRMQVAQRFANPRIADTVRRLCFDGSNRQPKFIVPTVASALGADGQIEGLALVSAMWRRYCLGLTEGGKPIAPNDPNWDRLHMTAQAAEQDLNIWLGMADIYGDTGRNGSFAKAFASADKSLRENGVAGAIGKWLAAAH